MPGLGSVPSEGRTGTADGTRGFGGVGSRGGMGGGMGGSVRSAMLSYLEKNQGNATWLVAVSSAQSASELILQSGKPVIAMGGFTGSDPAMTLAKMKSLIASGKLRFVLLGSGGMGGGPGGDQSNSEATSYVKSTCKVVSASTYGGTTSGSASSGSGAASGSTTSSQELYDCAS
jgi:hypothetical protein